VLRKALLLAGIFALGFIAGMGAILLYFERSSDASKWIGAVGTSYMVAQYAHTQYKEADYQNAVSALQTYIAYLDQLAPIEGGTWAPGRSPWLDACGLAYEKALAWARLAILHERNGNQAGSESAWPQAQSSASQASWRDTSKEHIRGVVLGLDR